MYTCVYIDKLLLTLMEDHVEKKSWGGTLKIRTIYCIYFSFSSESQMILFWLAFWKYRACLSQITKFTMLLNHLVSVISTDSKVLCVNFVRSILCLYFPVHSRSRVCWLHAFLYNKIRVWIFIHVYSSSAYFTKSVVGTKECDMYTRVYINIEEWMRWR